MSSTMKTDNFDEQPAASYPVTRTDVSSSPVILSPFTSLHVVRAIVPALPFPTPHTGSTSPADSPGGD